MAGTGGPQAPDRKPRPPAGPGKLANRQDMSQPGPPPTQGAYAPTGMPYGQAGAAIAAQRAVPLPANRGNVFAPGGSQVPGSPAPPPAGMAPSSAPAPAPPPPQPGYPDIASLMNRPTMNPGEPVTAGIPLGPGPGPTASPSPAGQVLAYLASTVFATPAVKDLARRVDLGGINL